MDVILLEKIGGLGELGDNVVVRSGYGRNYLLPNGKAVLATPENLEKVEKKRMELEKGEMQALEVAKGRAEAVEKAELTVFAKIGEENRLYGSVGTQDISEALTKAGAKVEKKEILLPHGPIREAGDHEVNIRLHADVILKVSVTVAPEEDISTA